MKIKTSELLGDPLDFAVAKAIGAPISRRSGGMICDGEVVLMAPCGQKVWSPSTDWSQGGPLIDRFDVYFDRYPLDQPGFVVARIGMDYQAGSNYFNNPSSPNRLIAACRAIVSDKLGDEVDIPEELL